ncbi:MAG: hypothetical protein AB4352_08225 [Hormoscilla sp.]
MLLSPVKNADFDPDIVVLDEDDNQIMFVDVRYSPLFVSEELTIHHLEDYQHVPFLMFVNREKINIYDSATFQVIFSFNTREILRFYDPQFEEKNFSQSYLIVFIQAWLRDFAFHWKSPHPPARTEIEKIGLLEKLDNGMTKELDW